MEKKPPLEMTPFDQMVSNDFLQLVKIFLPYLPPPLQRMAGIYVKLTEFQNAIYCFQPPYYHSRRGRLRPEKREMSEMMQEISPYLPGEMQDMMNSFTQAFDMMDMMKDMNLDDFMPGQNMGDLFQAFSAERTDNNERMDGKSESEESGSPETGTDPESSERSQWQERQDTRSSHDVSDHECQ